jgi:hypothetical protein
MTTKTLLNSTILLFISILFTNCAGLGTKTLYKSFSNEEIKKI